MLPSFLPARPLTYSYTHTIFKNSVLTHAHFVLHAQIHLSDPEAAPLIAGGHSSAAPSSSSASLHHHHSRSASRGHLPGSSSLAGPFTGSGLVRSASGAGLDGGGDAAAPRGAADDERPWVTIAGHSFSKRIVLVVVISALGYFVDVYDLLQFSILRVPSLRSLGLPPQRVTSAGILLLNLQVCESSDLKPNFQPISSTF